MKHTGLSDSPDFPDSSRPSGVTDEQLSTELRNWTGATPALHPVGELLDRHWEAAFAYARLCTDGPRAAGMLTTAAFTRLFGETLRHNGPTSAWRPQLLVTVRRIAAEWDADGRRELLHPDLRAAAGRGGRPAALLLPPPGRRLLSGAFQRLSQSGRCLLWHAEVESEPLAVPAGLLGLDEESARLQLDRAHDRLREEVLQLHRELAPDQECRSYLRMLDVTCRRSGFRIDPDLRDHLDRCTHCRHTADQLTRFTEGLGPALAEAILGWGARDYMSARARAAAGTDTPHAAEHPASGDVYGIAVAARDMTGTPFAGRANTRNDGPAPRTSAAPPGPGPAHPGAGTGAEASHAPGAGRIPGPEAEAFWDAGDAAPTAEPFGGGPATSPPPAPDAENSPLPAEAPPPPPDMATHPRTATNPDRSPGPGASGFPPGRGGASWPGAGGERFPGTGAEAFSGSGATPLPESGAPGFARPGGGAAWPGAAGEGFPGAGAEAFPGSGAKPSRGADADRFRESGGSGFPGTGAEPFPGSRDERFSVTGAEAFPGSGSTPSRGADADWSLKSGTPRFPSPDGASFPGPGGGQFPGMDAEAFPRSGSSPFSGADAEAFLDSNARAFPAAGAEAFPGPGAQASTGSNAQAFPRSNAQAFPRSNAQAFPGSGSAEASASSVPRPESVRRFPGMRFSGGGPGGESAASAPRHAAPRPGRKAVRRSHLAVGLLTVSGLIALPLVLWASAGPEGNPVQPTPPRGDDRGSRTPPDGGPSWAANSESAGGALRGRLQNTASGLCVGLVGGKAVAGAEAQLTACSGARTQLWTYESDGRLRSAAEPELCLDSRIGYSVRLGACADAARADDVRYDFTVQGALIPRGDARLALAPAATDGSGALVLKTRTDDDPQRWALDGTAVADLRMKAVTWDTRH